MPRTSKMLLERPLARFYSFCIRYLDRGLGPRVGAADIMMAAQACYK